MLDTNDITMPYVCGFCDKKFLKILPYFKHFKEHNKEHDIASMFHICDQESDNLKTGNQFTCRTCQNEFPTLCSLHSHILVCSRTGSYFYDHKRSVVLPIVIQYDLRKDEVQYIVKDSVKIDLKKDVKDTATRTRRNVVKESVKKEMKNIVKKPTKKQSSNISINKNGKEIEHEKEAENDILEGDKVEDKKENEEIIEEDNFEKEREVFEEDNFGGEENSPTDLGMAMNTEVSELSNDRESEKTLQQRGMRTRYLTNRTRKTWMHLRQKGDTLKKQVKKSKKTTKSESKRAVANKPIENKSEMDERENSDSEKSSPKQKKPKTADKQTSAQGEKNDDCVKKKRIRKKKEPLMYECNICGKKCQGSNRLKFHMISHSDVREHKCELCDASYKYPYHLSTHMKTHSGIKPFICDICGKGFVEAIRLKSHKVHKHTVDRNFQCELCGCSFKFQGGLNRHLQIHNKPKFYICEVCGRQFLRENNLKEHLWTHAEIRRFPCTKEGCSRTFVSNYQLQYHLKVHRGERPVKCPECPRHFITKAECRKHMKKVHCETKDGQKTASWSEREWKCDYCSSAFTERKGLKHHMKFTHSLSMDGLRLEEVVKGRHECRVCSALFTLDADLERHVKNIHSQTPEGKHIEGCWDNRPHRCGLCQSAFSLKRDLKKHIVDTHSDYLGIKKEKVEKIKCPICVSKYNSEHDLKKHLKSVHSQNIHGEILEGFWNNRPFRCHCCLSAFMRIKDFKKHMKENHQLELDKSTLERMKIEMPRTEKCPHCPQRFVLKNECLMHIKRVHGRGKQGENESLSAETNKVAVEEIPETVEDSSPIYIQIVQNETDLAANSVLMAQSENIIRQIDNRSMHTGSAQAKNCTVLELRGDTLQIVDSDFVPLVSNVEEV